MENGVEAQLQGGARPGVLIHGYQRGWGGWQGLPIWPAGTVWLTWASLVLSAPSLHGTLSFLTPGSPIRKALVECWFHSVQFRNCMLSTHRGPGLWGNKGPFLKMSQFSRKTDKDIDSYHSVWLEGSMGTIGT